MHDRLLGLMNDRFIQRGGCNISGDGVPDFFGKLGFRVSWPFATLTLNHFQIGISSSFFNLRFPKSHILALELLHGIFRGGGLYIYHDMINTPSKVRFSSPNYAQLKTALDIFDYNLDA